MNDNRVIVADAESGRRARLVAALERSGWAVTTMASGRQLLPVLSGERTEYLVVLSNELTQLSGLDALLVAQLRGRRFGLLGRRAPKSPHEICFLTRVQLDRDFLQLLRQRGVAHVFHPDHPAEELAHSLIQAWESSRRGAPRRRERRLDSNLTAHAQHGEAWHRGEVLDLSAHGCRVSLGLGAAVHVELGQQVQLRLAYPVERELVQVELEAIVQWSRIDGMLPPWRVAVGYVFVDLSPQVAQRLETILTSLSGRLEPPNNDWLLQKER